MAQVVDRRATASGEILLRRGDAGYEIILGGVFAMAGPGPSEQLQVDVTLAAAANPERVLVGGLGLGVALGRVLAHPAVAQVVVVEIEPAVIDWHRTHLAELTGDALADPRVAVVEGDVADAVLDATAPYDAILLDVDNGPDWLIRARNARLYRNPFLQACARATTDRGVFSVWSAQRPAGLAAGLARVYEAVEEHRVEVPRGEPDWIGVAIRPRR